MPTRSNGFINGSRYFIYANYTTHTLVLNSNCYFFVVHTTFPTPNFYFTLIGHIQVEFSRSLCWTHNKNVCQTAAAVTATHSRFLLLLLLRLVPISPQFSHAPRMNRCGQVGLRKCCHRPIKIETFIAPSQIV